MDELNWIILDIIYHENNQSDCGEVWVNFRAYEFMTSISLSVSVDSCVPGDTVTVSGIVKVSNVDEGKCISEIVLLSFTKSIVMVDRARYQRMRSLKRFIWLAYFYLKRFSLIHNQKFVLPCELSPTVCCRFRLAKAHKVTQISDCELMKNRLK